MKAYHMKLMFSCLCYRSAVSYTGERRIRFIKLSKKALVEAKIMRMANTDFANYIKNK